ncbi:MAG: hypothetical protein ACRBM6_02680 [Geminicoccales bacterium]
MMKALPFFIAFSMVQPVLAEQNRVNGLPAFSEAILPVGAELYAVSIGPGGPGVEFGSDEQNGGLYKIGTDGAHTEIELSDGQGLRNPTGVVESDGQIVLVDGNQVISVSPDGMVHWRQSLDQEGVFFYDVEVLDDATLLVSDFGRGAFVSVASRTGDIQPYLDDVRVSGLARFEISEDRIYAVSWGADDAWNSAIHLVSVTEGEAVVEKLSDGFGNLESVEIIDGSVVVGGYRGHEQFQAAKLMRLDADGGVHPLVTGSDTEGVSDIYFDGTSIWLNYFYDAAYEKLPVKTLMANP